VSFAAEETAPEKDIGLLISLLLRRSLLCFASLAALRRNRPPGGKESEAQPAPAGHNWQVRRRMAFERPRNGEVVWLCWPHQAAAATRCCRLG
jgi:hypothetical protein